MEKQILRRTFIFYVKTPPRICKSGSILFSTLRYVADSNRVSFPMQSTSFHCFLLLLLLLNNVLHGSSHRLLLCEIAGFLFSGKKLEAHVWGVCFIELSG